MMKKPLKRTKPIKEPVVVTPNGVAHLPADLQVAVMRRGQAVEGEFKNVASSNIKAVRWERALTVEFHGGRRYTYIGVTSEVWRALMTAESHGKFLGEHIMKKYQYRHEGGGK
jgi:hypothetical protein